MKINFITFMVRNLKKSISFYKDLAGLQEIRRIKIEAGEIVFLANKKEETMLELIEIPNAETAVAKGMVMSFLTDAPLEELREKAVDLGYSPSEILVKGSKPKHFTVLDPDGIIVEFGI